MKTFVISLKSSVQRRAVVNEMLSNNSINFEFIDAIDISKDEVDHKSIYSPKKTLKAKGYKLIDAEIGCFCSHRKAWKLCVELDEPILIFEDNFELNTKLDPYIQYASDNIDVLGIIKFGAIFNKGFTVIADLSNNSKLVKYTRKPSGASCYVISARVAKKYLRLSNEFYLAVDDFMDMEFFTKTPLFTFYPNVVSRSTTRSTIGLRKIKDQNTLLKKVYIEYQRVKFQLLQLQYNIIFNLKSKKHIRIQQGKRVEF
jgi:glycosyl transferase family 25